MLTSNDAPESIETLRRKDPALEAFFNTARTLSLEAGETVFHPGSPCGHYYLLLEGQVRVFVLTPSGREIQLYVVRSGEGCVMTTACLLGEDPYNVFGITDTSVKVLAVPASLFHDTITNSTPFRCFVFKGFAHRLKGVLNRLEALMEGNITGMLIDVLLEEAQDRVVKLTHQLIADRVGTAREVISRHLKDLERRKLIALGRGQITVLDPLALKAAGRKPD